MNKIHYNVSGLQNHETRTQVRNALNKIHGISMINIDLGRSSIEVGYNELTDENEIKACIENVGCHVQ